jgi:hypothetical protein
MRKSWRKIFASGAAAVTAVLVTAVGAPSALATGTTWTVSPGGDYSGVTYSIKVTDTATGTQFACTHDGKIGIEGNFTSGNGEANPIGVIAEIHNRVHPGFTCTGPGGNVWHLDSSGEGWFFYAFKYDASTGVTTGKLYGFAINLYISPTDGCYISLDGTAQYSNNGKVRFQYHNADAQLDLLPGGAALKAVYLYNCSGVPVNQGDPMSVQAKFTLTPAQAISSP